MGSGSPRHTLGLLLSFIIYLQSVLGMTALQAGLTIVPWSVVSMIVAPIAGRLAALPAEFRQQFIDGFSHAVSTGLQVGQGQAGAATHLPSGVRAQLAQLLAQISHDVFVNAYLEAMKSTLYLPVAVVLLAAVVTVLLRRQAPVPAAARGEAGATANTASA
jgi:hypothetical protein